ncbi:MAG: type III secretion system translocon subunit SctE [Opitutales bacterium]|nr:type III secretion system translocon subunit SctE [Opitutales bacterium]
MPLDLDPSITANPMQANELPTDDVSTESTQNVAKTHHLTKTGISFISVIEDQSYAQGIFENPTLKAPTTSLADVMATPITVSAEVAQQIGVSSNTTFYEFTKACLSKIQALNNNSSTPSTNLLEGEDLDYLCTLLTLQAKSKLIAVLKETLREKINSRNELQQKFIKDQTKSTTDQVEAERKRAEAARKAKRRGIFGAIFGAIAAIAAAVVTVVTFGAATPLAVAVTTMAISSAVLCTTASALTIASLCTNNKELAAKLSLASTIIGCVGAAVGLVSSICSFKLSPQDLEKFGTLLKMISTGLSCTNSVVNGTFSILQGADQMELAELEKKIAEYQVKMVTMDKEIQTLSKFIDMIVKSVEEFIKDMLLIEEQGQQVMEGVQDTENALANNCV